jgi:hypothetical protein
MRPLFTIALLGVAACGWDNLPNQGSFHSDALLWDAAGSVATADGLYVPLPYAENLAFISTGGAAELVDLRPAALQQLTTSPDGQSAVAFLRSTTCTDEDLDGEAVHDCHEEYRETTTELAVMQGGDITQRVEVPEHFNAIEFSADSKWAVAWLDFTQQIEIGGVVSLTSVLVANLETGAATTVSVGFAADRVLFDPAGTSAVVLSRSEVAVIDLTTELPSKRVTFPLTLDPDDVVVPVGVELTPDGTHALISVQGRGDLYVLDLENPSVNLISLVGNPSAMAVDPTADRTLLTYSNTSRAEVMDHSLFETEVLDLDEPMDRILDNEGMALMWRHSAGHDAYRVDLETLDLIEYRLENPATQMHLAPTGEFAVALTRAEGGSSLYDNSPGLEILDLREGADDTWPYLLENAGVGAAFVATDTSLDVIVLQQQVDYIYRLDLYTQQPEQIELVAPPVDIGTIPNGPFYITHDDGLGLISFFDPTDNEITTVSGFATLGMLDDVPLAEVP